MTPSAEDPKDTKPEPEGGVQEVGERPEVVSILANGTPRGARGRFLPGVVPTNAITSTTAKDLVARRWAKAERESREAIKRKALEGGVDGNSAPAAFGAAVGEVYAGALANAMDRPHDASRALKFVGQAAGLLRPQERTSNLPTLAVQVNIGAGVEASWSAGGIVVEGEEG